MRDQNKILEILKRIKNIWKRNPNLRLGQLLANVINLDYLYEIEDDTLIELMENIYDT